MQFGPHGQSRRAPSRFDWLMLAFSFATLGWVLVAF
jgi:hypothetical protein